MKMSSNLDETRERILVAAKEQFLTNGYDATRLDDIVRKAHVSKTTIYKIFGGKRELFFALNEAILEDVISSLKIPQTEPTLTLEGVRCYLTKLGTEYLTALTKEERLSLVRLNISIATRFNEAAKNFFNKGPGALQNILSSYFDQIAANNILSIPNSKEAAGQFLSLVRGNHHLRALLDEEYKIAPEAIPTYVDNAVTLFINGHQKQSFNSEAAQRANDAAHR